MGHLEHAPIVLMAADDLDPDRQAILGEPAGTEIAG